MFIKVRRALVALSIIAASTVAVTVSDSPVSAAGAVAPSAATSNPSIGAQSVPTWSNTNIIAVSTGFNSSCAIQGSSSTSTSGTLFCWGKAGTLGTGATSDSNVAVAVTAANGFTNTAVTAVAIGDEHACAVEAGQIWCWGSAYFTGEYGTIGAGSTTARTPVLVSANGDFHNAGTSGDTVTAVTASFARTCAIEGGQSFCWGSNNSLQLGLGSNQNNPIRVPNRVVDTASPEFQAATATKISSGFFHTCAIASTSVHCWGSNYSFQLGNSTPTGAVPVKVSQGEFATANTNITAVDADWDHSCAVQGGKVLCWGENGDGQLGTGNTTTASTPTAVSASGTFANAGSVTAIAAGEGHSCAVDNGKLFCWGKNSSSQLGDGTSTSSNTPVLVATSDEPGFNNTAVTAVSAGDYHTCAIEAMVVYCWGSNSKSQLGDGSFYASFKPKKVFVLSAPGTATIDSIMPSNGSLSVSIRQPSDGGSIITGYDYTTNNGNTFTNVARPSGSNGFYYSINIPNLTNGMQYSVKVRAVNAIGAGDWSLATNATPSSGSSGGTIPSNPGTIPSTPSTPCVAGTPTSTSSLVSFDSAFAGDGAYDFSGQLASSSYTGAAAGPNGSLYVAASEGTEYSLTPTNSLTRVYRFLANGTLDSTWGNSGVASIDISASATNSERPRDVLVLSDGSVVVGISSTTFGSSMTVGLKLAKLTSAGALDATFGTNGLANIASGSSSVMLRTFVEGPARTIYVGKSTMTGNYPNMVTTYGVIKLSALGVVDSAFGTNGELATSSEVMATDSTGALYVGGLTSSTPADAKVVKYLPSGSIDTSFGASGEKVLSTSSGSGAESLSALVVANGKLSGVVGARGAIVNNFPSYETSLFRMNTSGVLDASFGSGGIALLGTVGNSIRDITVLSDGSAILTFFIVASGPPSWRFTAMTADGTPVASLVTALADLKSGTCELSDAAVVVTSAGLFVAGLAFPAGEGSPTTHIFKIALADFATGGSNTGGGSNTETPSGAAAPTLVTSANAAALVRAPGSESIIINGEEVVIESKTVSIPAARTLAAQRTAAQVKSIQQAGAALLQQFLASLPAGATSNVVVVNTATGAVMQNLVFDANGNSVNVPVEDIVFLDGPQLSLMIGSNNANITADGKYQVGAGAIVGVTGSGLGVSANGEIIAMSTPTLLANFQTTAAGDFNKSATLPSSIGVGDHTLVVATGSTYAMMGIRVVPAALPTTGSSTENVVIIALFTLVFGALFFRGRRISLI